MANKYITSFFAYGITILFSFSLINAESFTLTDCILWALENKKTVISQKLNIEIAKKDVEGAYSNFKPSIQLFSNKNRNSIRKFKINKLFFVFFHVFFAIFIIIFLHQIP